jgi:DNA-binding LacI/PurR family transcriptional regulator
MRTHTTADSFATPVPDPDEQAQLGRQHLLDLGHTRIAYLRGNSDLESSAVRYQGFHDALRLAGVDVDESAVAGSGHSSPRRSRLSAMPS